MFSPGSQLSILLLTEAIERKITFQGEVVQRLEDLKRKWIYELFDIEVCRELWDLFYGLPDLRPDLFDSVAAKAMKDAGISYDNEGHGKGFVESIVKQVWRSNRKFYLYRSAAPIHEVGLCETIDGGRKKNGLPRREKGLFDERFVKGWEYHCMTMTAYKERVESVNARNARVPRLRLARQPRKYDYKTIDTTIRDSDSDTESVKQLKALLREKKAKKTISDDGKAPQALSDASMRLETEENCVRTMSSKVQELIKKRNAKYQRNCERKQALEANKRAALVEQNENSQKEKDAIESSQAVVRKHKRAPSAKDQRKSSVSS